MLQQLLCAMALVIIWLASQGAAINLTCGMMKHKGPIVNFVDGTALWLNSGTMIEGWGNKSYFSINQTTVLVATGSQWSVVDLWSGREIIKSECEYLADIGLPTVNTIINDLVIIVKYSHFYEISLITGVCLKKDMPIGRLFPSLSMINGIPHLTGGSSFVKRPVLYYNDINNTWSENRTIMVDTTSHGSVVRDGILYICGGHRKNPLHLRMCTRYNITDEIIDEIELPCGPMVMPKVFVMSNTVYILANNQTGSILCMSKVQRDSSMCRMISTSSRRARFELILQCPESSNNEGHRDLTTKSDTTEQKSTITIATFTTEGSSIPPTRTTENLSNGQEEAEQSSGAVLSDAATLFIILTAVGVLAIICLIFGIIWHKEIIEYFAILQPSLQ